MTEITDRLREIAADDFVGSIQDAAEESPDFASAKWLTSWEWYVDRDLRELWHSLSEEARRVACIGAIEAWRRQNEMAP